MKGLGLLTPYELLQSQIQGVVGEFLTARTTLTKLTSHSDQAIVDEANKLLSIQSVLENELSIANKLMEKIKSGAYTMTDIAQATATMWAITDHNKSVKDLVNEAGGVPTSNIPWSTLAIIAGVGVGAYALFGRK